MLLPDQGIVETYDDAINGLKNAMKFNHYDNPYIYIIHHNLHPLNGKIPYKEVTKDNIYQISFEYSSKVIYVLNKDLTVRRVNYLFNNTELAIQRLKKYLWIDNFNEGDHVEYTYLETKKSLFKSKQIKVKKSGTITNISNKINEDIIHWDPIIEVDGKQLDLAKVENMISDN